MFRQRQLERCGWVFWRVAESKFRFEPEGAMASLWVKLAELGILPQKEVSRSVTEPPPTPREPTPDEKPTMAQNPPSAPVFENPVAQQLPTKQVTVPRDFADTDPIQQSELPLAHDPISRPPRHANELDPIAKFILDQLAVPKRLETNALILDAIRRLGLGSDGRSKIEKAIRSLENHGLITVGANYIGKKDTYG